MLAAKLFQEVVTSLQVPSSNKPYFDRLDTTSCVTSRVYSACPNLTTHWSKLSTARDKLEDKIQNCFVQGFLTTLMEQDLLEQDCRQVENTRP